MDDHELRSYVKMRVDKWAEFAMHLTGFIFGNALIWSVWALELRHMNLIFPLMVTLGWLIGLAIHGVDVFYKTVVMERTYKRELERINGYIKPKRNGRASFTSDGELVIPDDAETHYQEARHN